MIPLADETITLYNRQEVEDTNKRTVVTWHRTVLSKCSWVRRVEHTFDGIAMVLSEVSVCRIPEDARYLPPAEWDKATNDPTDHFTLAPGDIVVYGAVEDEVDETFRITALVDKYRRQGVMTIISAKDNTRPGTPLGHYLARGV